MTEKKARELLDKYLNGDATPEERLLFERLSNLVTKERLKEVLPESYDHIGAEIYEKLPKKEIRTIPLRFIAAAASLIVIVSAALIYNLGTVAKLSETNTSAKISDVQPGKNQATLTLANGKKIELTAGLEGKLAQQAGISINKTADGQLVYTVSAQDQHQFTAYNTTETPRGGQFQVNLSDGTKVWLNSSSSLKYPTRFDGSQRLVELHGEAYFEVAHNKKMPFKVKTSRQMVTVLGTHFNINAYHDEPYTSTTLLEGKVKVNILGNTGFHILKPGDQAYLSNEKITVTPGDTEQAIAWKNGYFRFRGENIESIMRKLSRWYNVDINYETNVSDEGYYGTVSRSKNISQVLAVLTETGSVHFKIEGRSVTVMR